MRLILLAAAAALFQAGAAAAQTGDNPVLTDWSVEDMGAAITQAGSTLGPAQMRTDDMVIPVTTEGGLPYVVMGSGCTGIPMRCRAANMLISLRTGSVNAVQAMGIVDYAALSETPLSPEVLALSRHILFDGGITRANLVANIETFENLVAHAANDLAAGQLTAAPAAPAAAD